MSCSCRVATQTSNVQVRDSEGVVDLKADGGSDDGSSANPTIFTARLEEMEAEECT